MDRTRILNELRSERKSIDAAIAALENISVDGASRPKKTLRPAKRRMSASARRRLSQLLKARWASGKMSKRSLLRLRAARQKGKPGDPGSRRALGGKLGA